MADQKTITVREAQELLQQMNLSYGRGAQITVDKDFNFALAETPENDGAEESPEASQKRAERQQKEEGVTTDLAPAQTNQDAAAQRKAK